MNKFIYLKNYNINALFNYFDDANIIKRVKKEYNATDDDVILVIKKMQSLGYKVDLNTLSIYNTDDGLISSYIKESDVKKELEYYKKNNIDPIYEIVNCVANNLSRYKRGYKIY